VKFISGSCLQVTPSWVLLLWKGDVFFCLTRNCSGMRRIDHFYLSASLIKNGFNRRVSTQSALMSTLTLLYYRWLYWEQICDLTSGVRESVYAVSNVHPPMSHLTVHRSQPIHPSNLNIRLPSRLTAPHSSDLLKKIVVDWQR